MSGEARGPRAAALRAALAVAEVPYTLAVRTRNGLFNSHLRAAARLPRPVISVGNITSGGTGKTPVVRWLAEQLREAGRSVAILSRGYKAAAGKLGDEQRMLGDMLNVPGKQAVVIRADPSRLRAGREVLREHEGTDAFLLDDGFQHRRLARDFDLVLINAVEPFGHGHVLPRGLLREPLGGLRRASALLITRADQASDARLAEVKANLREYHPTAPIYEAVHAHTGFRSEADAGVRPPDALRGRRWFAFCGIADPHSFIRQLAGIGGTCAGSRVFSDHHAYTNVDLRSVLTTAVEARADLVVTTEKDWVKLAVLPGALEGALPVWRADLHIRFRADHEERLLRDIKAAMAAGLNRHQGGSGTGAALG